MTDRGPIRIGSIADFHRFRRLPAPAHPLISVIDRGSMPEDGPDGELPKRLVLDFYTIALKRCRSGKVKYGQQEYDYDEGLMSFMAPGQVFGIEPDPGHGNVLSGWTVLVHPDFLWNTPLAAKIKGYEYFDYAVNEALFLSPQEEETITRLIRTIDQEHRANVDGFSQDIIIAQLELLLTYSQRFYHRQFITRRIESHRVLDRLEAVLNAYFDGGGAAAQGLPSVHSIARELNLSSNYLSSLLKALTGRSTQQHIHDRLIERAKQELSTTDLTVSEIAYSLGFEYSQSFSKFFKKRTNLSPLEFRRSFN